MQENNLEQVSDQSPNIVENTEVVNSENSVPTTTNVDNDDNDASYGKFKSAESLYKAYKQLEKEFTKKSQKLRAYLESTMSADDTLAGMIAVNPELSNYAEELRGAITAGTNSNIKLAECLNGRVSEPCHIIKNEDFLDSYVYSNADIKGKIIADYLETLQERRSPMTIKGRGNAYVSPAYRPHSLQEASKLATKFIQNRRI